MKTVIIILGVGLPIWLIIAWVYDFSLAGIKKTEAVTYDAEISRKKNISLNRFIIGGLSIAVILLLVNTFRLRGEVNEWRENALNTEFKSSIAILALTDLSPNKDQQYFSDGLSRSIYRQLARYKDLKVINPTSSFYYKDKNVSLDVIAQELGVEFILEGSVQRYGTSFRASLNLIDSSDGSTIWTKTFDDKFEDILIINDKIATTVAQYLKLTLDVPDIKTRKVDPEAYELYLRAEDTLNYYDFLPSLAADSLIRKSIEIDPTYAPSYSSLSMITLHKGLYHGQYTYEEAIEIGLNAAKKAVELDAEYALGYVWLSNWEWHARNAEASKLNLELAFQKSPNNSYVHYYAAHYAARQNRLLDSDRYSTIAIELDPKNRDAYVWSTYSNMMLGNYDISEKTLNIFYSLSKSKEGYYGEMGYLSLLKGDVSKALKYAQKETYESSRLIVQTLAYIFSNDDKKANENLQEFLNTEDDTDFDKDFYQAIFFSAWGKKDEAFTHLNKAHDFISLRLEWFFTFPEFRNLYDDPRWDDYIDRLSKEFNYDFPHQPELARKPL